MIFFLLALFFSIGILIIFKAFEKYEIRNLQAIVVSYFISGALAVGYSYSNNNITEVIGNNYIIAIILGISFFIGFVFLSLSTQKLGLSITSIAVNISVIIPVIVAAIIYKEKIYGYHLLGLMLAFPGFYLILKPNTKEQIQWKLILYPIILFFIGGLNNSLLRQAEINGAMDSPMAFLGILFSIAFAISVIYTIITKRELSLLKKELGFGILLGIFNFSSTYFFLNSRDIFHSALYFSIYNLSFIAISALIGLAVYKEKLSKTNYIGLSVAAVAILLMNL